MQGLAREGFGRGLGVLEVVDAIPDPRGKDLGLSGEDVPGSSSYREKIWSRYRRILIYSQDSSPKMGLREFRKGISDGWVY